MQHTAAVDLLSQDIAAIEALAAKPAGTAAELAGNLAQIYILLVQSDFARYNVVAAKAAAPDLIKRMFAVRLELRNRIAGWQAQGILSRDVQKGLRDVFRVGRYFEDLIGEIGIGHDRLGVGGTPLRAFSGNDSNTVLNPRLAPSEPVQFHSGDVILVRGQLHNSAAIARIGDVDSQFSHVGVVYIDDAAKGWVVESLIEDGAVIGTLDAALDHGLGRAVLYRHKDQALAARAALQIREHVARSHTWRGRRILYDFGMELEGYDNLYCSKLVRQAYELGSGGKVKLPTYATLLDMKNRDFMKRIGVTAHKTFAPADIDMEPDFDLVVEWRDYRITSNLRLQDMVMTKLFEWMDSYNYKFREDFAIWLIGVLGRASSFLSDKSKELMSNVVPKVPSNMSRSTIATIAMLHKTAEPLYRRLLALDQETISQTGHAMHPREALGALERIREESKGRIGYLVAKP